MIGDGDDDMGSDDVYNKRAEPVLVSLSNLYSDEKISVSASGPSSCPILHCLLTTFTTALKNSVRFCPKKDILL